MLPVFLTSLNSPFEINLPWIHWNAFCSALTLLSSDPAPNPERLLEEAFPLPPSPASPALFPQECLLPTPWSEPFPHTHMPQWPYFSVLLASNPWVGTRLKVLLFVLKEIESGKRERVEGGRNICGNSLIVSTRILSNQDASVFSRA